MIKALFSSKKFIMSMVGVVVAVTGHFRPEMADMIQNILMMVVTFVGGQALADFGKSAK